MYLERATGGKTYTGKLGAILTNIRRGILECWIILITVEATQRACQV